MAKAKRTRVKRAKKAVRPMRTNKPTRVPRPMAQPIEKALRDYVALLKDPCNGPLVGPVGATANGYITRFEKTLEINTGQPNWGFIWTPGALASTSVQDGGFNSYVTATPSAAFNTASLLYLNDAAPGYAFLAATCQTFRCLAACVQVRYTDTEVNRKGIVGSTICSGARSVANATEGLSISVDRARIPDQSLEVLWQPGEGDEMFTPVSSSVLDLETRARKNAICLTGTGCQNGSISVRLVVVYQWTPGSNDSIILPIPTPGTGVTMARVIQLARQTGFVAGHLIKAYATGGLYGVAREAASMIKPSIRNMR